MSTLTSELPNGFFGNAIFEEYFTIDMVCSLAFEACRNTETRRIECSLWSESTQHIEEDLYMALGLMQWGEQLKRFVTLRIVTPA
jgi:hypothetical protein